jgi:hypothetical protein
MTLIVVEDRCLHPDCTVRTASGFLLCWDHWASLPKAARNSAWEARKLSLETHDPDVRAQAQRGIEQFKRDLITLFTAKACP